MAAYFYSQPTSAPVEISLVGWLPACGGLPGLDISAAAARTPALQDGAGNPLTGNALTTAATQFAAIGGFLLGGS